MKKLFTLLIAIVSIVSLSACSASDGGPSELNIDTYNIVASLEKTLFNESNIVLNDLDVVFDVVEDLVGQIPVSEVVENAILHIDHEG